MLSLYTSIKLQQIYVRAMWMKFDPLSLPFSLRTQKIFEKIVWHVAFNQQPLISCLLKMCDHYYPTTRKLNQTEAAHHHTLAALMLLT